MRHDAMFDPADREFSPQFPLPRRPRTLLWVVFAVALLIALLAPLAQLWRAGVTPLDAQACVWPHAPLVGQPAQIVITLPAGAGHTAGAWSHAAAEWDMVSMHMGMRRASTTPSQEDTGQEYAITIPLALDMAGAWAARIVLQAPGRPDWTSTLTFNALGSDQANETPTPAAMAGCAETPTDRSIGGAP
ncbi:MAG TPA: hypothetical protein VH349_12920 [Ktedonobacterales bacterium]|jgi:hypothetical protein